MKNIAMLSAPGKAILCGEHAVVYGQDAIAFAIDLKTYANIFTIQQQYQQHSVQIVINMKIQNQIKTVHFTQQIIKISQQLSISNKNQNQNEFELNYECFIQSLKQKILDKTVKDPIIQSTLYKIALFLSIQKIDLKKFNQLLKNKKYLIQTWTQIPISKGLGSSASFNTILSTCLLIIACKLQKTNIPFQRQEINQLSKRFQAVQHGKPSGIDNFVSVYGGLVLFNKRKSPQFQHIDSQVVRSNLNHFGFAFVDSQIQKNTKLAVQNVRNKYDLHLKGQQKYKHIIQQIGTFSKQILTILSDKNIPTKQLQEKIFTILQINHSHLKSLGLSNQTIQSIVQKYMVENRSVAKITGAGMGGVVLIVGDKKHVKELGKNQKVVVCGVSNQGLQVCFY